MKQYDDHNQQTFELRISIPWEPNTAKGFAGALALLIVLGLLLIFVKPEKDPPTTIPYEVLATIKFGEGEGTGRSRGNLTAEGTALKALKQAPKLVDASTPAMNKKSSPSKRARSSTEGGRIIPVTNTVNERKHDTSRTAIALQPYDKDGTQPLTGNTDGSLSGTGRGTSGSGSGEGTGYGDIEWSGGGSAIVVRKVLPTAPEGLSRSTIVRLRFVVSPTGEVLDVRPIVRGIPEAETAAIRAIRQWRFKLRNPDSLLVGIITFRFDVN